LGNGDVDSYSKAMECIAEFGVDGVMVGTGVFKNPWMFNSLQSEISMEMRIVLLTKHITLYDKVWGKAHNFNVLKRFFKIYLNGFEGAAHWRDKLMHTNSCDGALKMVKQLQEG
jgi:tRNA-dihydrouridine synthase